MNTGEARASRTRRATTITIVRGKSQGEQYLKIIDDGEGIADFAYVATHIGDSIKRKLKREGEKGIQGEFGIGMLSFWTVGEELTLTSRDAGGVVRKMRLVKDSPAYSIRDSRELFDQPGTTLHIQPILSGVRMLSGEKIQSYLASELRDRITRSAVRITIIDRTARKELTVVPRKFHGALVHDLPALRSALGEVYVELYLCDPASGSGVGLYKSGTRIMNSVSAIDALDHPPWSSGYLEGIVDADFLNLTPGTRSGIVYDEAFSMLPEEQYGWLASQVSRGSRSVAGAGGSVPGGGEDGAGGDSGAAEAAGASDGAGAEGVPGETIADQAGGQANEQPAFFEMPGPLYRVDIRPAKATVGVQTEQTFTAVARDKSRRTIESDGLEFSWSVTQGAGTLESGTSEFATYRAPAEPELAMIRVAASQWGPGGAERSAEAEATITVTAELLKQQPGERGAGKGLPGYTFSYLPGSLWRSRYEESELLITINSGHADFVHASRQPKAKLRYVARLYAKEIVLANFPGESRDELLERLVELTMYMDEHLR